MTPKEFQKAIITIDREVLNELPMAEYKGKIQIIDSLDKLDNAINDLYKSKIVGFDTETRPSFRKGQNFNVSLIQLSNSETTYLFRTNIIGFPQSLIKLLEDEKIFKVGLSIHDDFHNLRKSIDIEPAGFIDLQKYVKEFKISDISLTKIYAILFDERISKGQRLTNWETSELSEAQKSYASLDAYACLRIYEFLKKGNFDPRESKYLSLPLEETANTESDIKETIKDNEN